MGAKKVEKLLPVYLICGADQLKRERAVERLKARLPEGMELFNLDERTATADLDAQDLLVSLQTFPMGSEFRLVIVHAVDKLPKAAAEMLVDYVKDPNEVCVCCLEAEALDKRSRLYKAIAKREKGSVLEFAQKKRWELPDDVVKMGGRHGVVVERTAAEELISRVGESTTMLDNQVATLAALCAASGVITRADVEEHVARIAEVKPWDFLDAVCERNAKRAISLYRLMQCPSLNQLVALLEGRLRELVCAKSLAARGQGSELAAELGKRDWQVKNHAHWARAWTDAELVGALRSCVECERALKGSADSETAFIGLVVGCCKGAR